MAEDHERLFLPTNMDDCPADQDFLHPFLSNGSLVAEEPPGGAKGLRLDGAGELPAEIEEEGGEDEREDEDDCRTGVFIPTCVVCGGGCSLLRLLLLLNRRGCMVAVVDAAVGCCCCCCASCDADDDCCCCSALRLSEDEDGGLSGTGGGGREGGRLRPGVLLLLPLVEPVCGAAAHHPAPEESAYSLLFAFEFKVTVGGGSFLSSVDMCVRLIGWDMVRCAMWFSLPFSVSNVVVDVLLLLFMISFDVAVVVVVVFPLLLLLLVLCRLFSLSPKRHMLRWFTAEPTLSFLDAFAPCSPGGPPGDGGGVMLGPPPSFLLLLLLLLSDWRYDTPRVLTTGGELFFFFFMFISVVVCVCARAWRHVARQWWDQGLDRCVGLFCKVVCLFFG